MSNIIWRLEKLKSMLTGKKSLVTRETTLTAMTKTEFDNSKVTGSSCLALLTVRSNIPYLGNLPGPVDQVFIERPALINEK